MRSNEVPQLFFCPSCSVKSLVRKRRSFGCTRTRLPTPATRLIVRDYRIISLTPPTWIRIAVMPARRKLPPRTRAPTRRMWVPLCLLRRSRTVAFDKHATPDSSHPVVDESVC
jgi:hypothetical protein